MTDKHLGTFINPFTDFGFKKLFGSEESKPLLMSFLNDLLPLKNEVPVEFHGDIIEGAFELAKLANMTHQDRHAYELSLKYYRDFINVLDTTKSDKALEIAKNLLDIGLDIESIAKATGVSKEIILQIK